MKTWISNWHLMRIIRLILAIAILIQSWYAKDTTTAILGVVLLATAAFNVGCCGPSGCYTPVTKTKNISPKNTDYEEVV